MRSGRVGLRGTITTTQTAASTLLWCADFQETLTEPLYVDAVHYTERMSERLARHIAQLLAERKLLPPY